MKLRNLNLILVQFLAQFGRVRNYWCSPASSPDIPLALRARMVGWQGSATGYILYIYSFQRLVTIMKQQINGLLCNVYVSNIYI